MTAAFQFDNTYAKELEGFYVAQRALRVQAPSLLLFNHQLAVELGLGVEGVDDQTLAEVFSGTVTPDGAEPIAQAYAGHQFGGFSPQLGDGRALLLGEVVDAHGARWDIQLKGSGPTPFSRGGDGLAPLGPVLREYLMAEAMHALGIETTRALAAVATNTPVYREEALPGAVLTRVASSHVRIGTFQYFAARSQEDKLEQLADYVIKRHYPELVQAENPYVELLGTVADRQAALVASWMSIGFIHGVMNTDNMAIAGETIDYGPCAFMDRYDPATVFSSIDRAGRYAYGNQPGIAQWNLARFAEALLPLIHTDEKTAVELATERVVQFQQSYESCWLDRMTAKLGIVEAVPEDRALVEQLLTLLQQSDVDFTSFFRALGDVALGREQAESALVERFRADSEFSEWLVQWTERLGGGVEADENGLAAVGEAMQATNPLYVPRNHLVEGALEAAFRDDDLEPFNELQQVLADPYTERDGLELYSEPGSPDTAYRTFCGT